MMIYRGYELEQKPLMVGWQVTIRKQDTFVRNGGVCRELDMALSEARSFVDALEASASSAPPAAS